MRRAIRQGAALCAVLTALCAPALAGPAPANLDLAAHARAEGNRLDEAVALAKLLLPVGGPAQILKVRVDGVGAHTVAGVLLEGGAKHAYGREAFLREVSQIAAATLDRSAVEEVDIWAIVPISVPKGAVVTGPMAVPTSKNVFAVTFPRNERSAIDQTLKTGRGVYYDAAWEATLVAATEGGASASPNGGFFAAKELSIRIES